MISTKRSDSDLPGNLPLLTQVVDEDSLGDLPTLTEVVADTKGMRNDFSSSQEFRELPTPSGCENPCGAFSEPTNLAAQGNGVDTAEIATDFQPVISQEVASSEAAIPPPRILNEEEMQQLLHQLEKHLETVFIHKLSLNLEQLQRQAVEQAVNELKAELSELLRDALNIHP